jgi:hypothetical protein
MALIEPDQYSSNLRPLSIFGRHLVTACALTSLTRYDVLYKALSGSASFSRYAASTVEPREAYAIVCCPGFNKPGDHVVPHTAMLCRLLPCWAYEVGEVIRPTMWSDNNYIAFGPLRLALGRRLEGHIIVPRRIGDCDRTEWKILVESADLPRSHNLVCIR